MREKFTLWALAAVLLGTMIPAFAGSDDAAELGAADVRGTQRRVAANEVVLNGKVLFVVPVGTGTLSAAERTSIIRDRLEEIAAHYVIGSNTVTVAESNADTFVIAVAGEAVATVEPRLAIAAGASSTEDLANAWAKSLRETLPKARPATRLAKVARP